jgi:hypothetical protein
MQDVWTTAFSFCSKRELGRIAQVCKEWAQLSVRSVVIHNHPILHRDSVWFVLYCRDLGDLGGARHHQRGWKQRYKNYKPQCYVTYGDPYNHKISVLWKSKTYPDGLWSPTYHRGSTLDLDGGSYPSRRVLIVGK